MPVKVSRRSAFLDHDDAYRIDRVGFHLSVQGSSQAASLGDQIEHICRIAVPQQLGATAWPAIEG
ncbi:hypothetical protein ACI2L4_33735 [Streptomyces sparsogenes]|uniref:hypothetical protein n=1 Tax=Streptomyces sparsogenes TaxID=67365 RepID=UPI0033F5D4BA